MYSVASVMAILAAENENRLLDVLPQADFVRLERFLLSVREKCITEDFVHKNYVHCSFCNDSTHFFGLEPLHQRTLRFLFGDCLSF